MRLEDEAVLKTEEAEEAALERDAWETAETLRRFDGRRGRLSIDWDGGEVRIFGNERVEGASSPDLPAEVSTGADEIQTDASWPATATWRVEGPESELGVIHTAKSDGRTGMACLTGSIGCCPSKNGTLRLGVILTARTSLDT